MTEKRSLIPAAGEFLVFIADDGTAQAHEWIENGTVCLCLKHLMVLYGTGDRTINEHLGNIYDEGGGDPCGNLSKFRLVQAERNRTRLHQIARGEGARDGQG